MKKLIWILILIPILYVGGVILHGTIVDFQPEAETATEVLKEGSVANIQDSVLSFAIWNIGYAGRGEESDCFYKRDP